MKKYLYTLLAAMTFIGCQKVVDADKLLDTEERISIIGFLSPSDTVLRVNVSKALSSIGTPIPLSHNGVFPSKFLITDATVTIANEDGDRTILEYSAENNTYSATATSLPIVIGKTYHLEVIVDGNAYTASCTIPKKVPTINETVSIRKDGFGNQFAHIDLNFEDFGNEDNFYVLGGSYNATIRLDGEISTNSNTLAFDGDGFLTDNLQDGKTLSGSGEVYIGNNDDIDIIKASITLQLGHVEEALYQSLRASSLNERNDGNPFVEYSIAPNNFLDEGAFGVFVGYTITQKVIELK